MKYYKLITVFFVLSLMMGAHFIYAQEDTSASAPPADTSASGPVKTIPTLKNPIEANNISDLLLSIADLIIFIGVIMAVFMFIFIGFKLVWAQGNDEALKEAKRWFMYAVIGTAILISSKVIVQVIKNTLVSAGVVEEKLWNNPK